MLKVTVEADSTACDTGYISDIPLAVFSGSPNVYSQFCDEVDGYHGHQPVSWTVDTSGGLLHDTTELNQQPSDMPVERSPPPLLSDYTIDLAYNPTRKGVSCTPHSSCADTFATIGSTCGRNGQTGDLMTYQGSSGSGCGLYTYFIAPPPNRISVRRCYPLDYFGEHHMKVQPWALDKTIREFVCKPDRPRIQASDNSTWMLNTLFRINWVPYLFQVYWKQGCYQRAMDADFDFPIEGRPQVNCTSLLWNDFTQCQFSTGFALKTY